VQLSDFAKQENFLPMHELAGKSDLVRDIQMALATLGVLEPPVDGALGAVTQWAIADFTEHDADGEPSRFTPAGARRLIEKASQGPKPLDLLNADLAARAAAAMVRRGYWIAARPDCVNIVYFEGVDHEGNLVANKPNAFNDLRLVFRLDDNSRPELLGRWDGTTEPGRYWTEHPMNSNGAARISFSQRKAWTVGTHHPGKPGEHEALVQVDKITVYRDRNHDFSRVGDKAETGLFAINQHWGYDLPPDDIGKAGAGCLIGRTRQGHRDFMNIVKGDARCRASRSYRFLTAVMPGSALHEHEFNPSDPH
jgi:hypothetical protein